MGRLKKCITLRCMCLFLRESWHHSSVIIYTHIYIYIYIYIYYSFTCSFTTRKWFLICGGVMWRTCILNYTRGCCPRSTMFYLNSRCHQSAFHMHIYVHLIPPMSDMRIFPIKTGKIDSFICLPLRFVPDRFC
jgi:hypothetical protein